MSALPTYEKDDPARLATDDELERQPLVEPEPDDAAAPPADVNIAPPPPLPWAEGEARHPVTFRFVPPGRLRALGGDCVGVLGRSKEETIGMVRRAFPAAFRPVPDDRVLVRIRREFASAAHAAVVGPPAAAVEAPAAAAVPTAVVVDPAATAAAVDPAVVAAADPAVAPAADYVSLSPDWFDWRYSVRAGEADGQPPWPDVVEVRIEQTAAELEADARRRIISPFFPLIGLLPMLIGLLTKKCKKTCECAG